MGVVRGLSAVLCALVASALVASLDAAFLIGVSIDSGTQAGQTELNNDSAVAFLVLWVVFGLLYWRSGSVRRIFGWMFLTCGLGVLGFPLTVAALSAAITGRQTTTAAGIGAGAGGTVLTLGVAVVSFFFAAIMLIVAFVLLSGGRRRPVTAPVAIPVVAPIAPMGATKKCPDCAEMVQADARICRFCRHDFGAESRAPG